MAAPDQALVRLVHTNPERPPDWRWRRCAALLDRSRVPSARLEDKLTARAGAFMRKLRAGDSHDDLCRSDPVFYEAFRTSSEAHTTRWVLEALVMADCSAAEIGERFGWVGDAAEVAPLYESVFFDVRSRLKRPAYVMSNLIDMGAVHAGSAPDSVMWRLLAWQGMRLGRGAELLDAYIEAGPLSDDAAKWLDELIRGQVTRRAARTAIRLSGLEDPEIGLSLIQTHVSEGREDSLLKSKLPSTQTGDSARRQKLLESLSISAADISKAHERALSPIEPRAIDSLTSDIMKRLARSPEKSSPRELPGREE